MIRRPPRSTRTDTLFPYTTLFRSNSRTDDLWNAVEAAGAQGLTAIAHDFTGQPGIPLIRMTGSRCEGGASVITVTQGEFSRDRRDTIDAEGRRWQVPRSEERRVGKECVSPGRARWVP